jgi:hypothetical protein
MAIRYLSGVNIDSNTLVVDSTNNRVGINTASPDYALDLGTSGTGNQIRARRIYANGTGTDSGYTLDSTLIFQGASNSFNITNPGSYPSVAFTINSSGNVGIGTTSPAYKLDVAGDARFGDGNNFNPLIQFAGSGRVAASPGYSFVGDLDTGMFNPNLGNTLAFTTAGSERMRIDSYGNVGIGTTGPIAKLHVFATNVLGGNSGDFTILSTLQNSGGSGGNNVYENNWSYRTATGTEWTTWSLWNGISVDASFVTPTTSLTWHWREPLAGKHHFGSGGSNVMTIGPSNVGIGTTSPGHKLSVFGGDAIFTRYTGTGNGSSLTIVNSTTTSDGTALQASYFGSGGYGPLKFEVGGSERMRITSAGNVGIGTTSPAVRLDYGASVNQAFHLYTSGVDYYGINMTQYDSGPYSTNIFSGDGGQIKFRTATGTSTQTTRMTITQAGNVGIGTTSPNSYAGYTALTLDNPASGGIIDLEKAGTRIGSLNVNDGNFNIVNPIASDMLLFTSFQERLRITAGGNVGIGITAPAYKLDVDTSFGVTFGAGGQVLRINREGLGSIGITGTKIYSGETLGFQSNDASTSFNFAYGNTSLMTIKSDGNVGIGTTAPSGKLHVYGGSFITDLDATYHQGILNEYVSTYVTRTKFGRWNTSSNLEIYYDIAGTEEARITRNYNVAVLKFDRAGTTDMIINGSGNVGIGTTSTFGRLQISGAGNPDLSSATATNISLIVSNNDVGYGTMFATYGSGIGALQQRRTNTNTYYDFVLQPHGGNVGIGTTNPVQKLQVDGSIYSNGGNLYINGDKSIVAVGTMIFETWNGSAYAERLRIDGVSGNVGIGTTSPSVKLEIADSIPVLRITGTRDASWTIDQTIASLEYFSKDSSGTAANSVRASINLVNETSVFGSTTGLSFSTKGDVAGLPTERMRISAAGNVGIGTTSPTHKLQVVGPGTFASTATAINGNVGLYMTIGGSANNYNGILFQGVSVADMYFGRAAGAGVDDLIIFGGGELVRFKQNGNVGIGTTSPSYKLQAEITDATAYSPTNTLSAAPIFWAYNSNATAGVAATIRLDGGQSGGNGAVTISSVHVGSGSSAITFGTRNSSSNVTERVRIDNLGNVGIGTTSPTNKLHVNGGSIFNQDGFLYMSNQFPIVWGAAVSIEGDNVAGTLTLKTESSHRIFINNVGNVGVGTTSPTNRLTVTTATNAVDVLRLNNTGGDSGSVQGVTHLAINHFNSGTNPSTRITAYQDSTSGWPGGMYFSTRSLNTDSAPVERMRITSGGNVGIGTTSPQYMLDVNGDAQINAEGTGPAYAYVPDGGFGLDSLITSGVENVALGKPDVWLRIHVDGVAFVFPGYQEP